MHAHLLADMPNRLLNVFSLLVNSNPKLNISERMFILSSVNKYFIENEYRIKELEIDFENKIQKLSNEIDNLKNNSFNKENM